MTFLGDSEGRHEPEVLMHHRNSGVERITR